MGAAHQAPLGRAQSYDSEDGDEFDDVDYAQLEEAQAAAAAAANQSEHGGHHSTASNLQALFNGTIAGGDRSRGRVVCRLYLCIAILLSGVPVCDGVTSRLRLRLCF